jgi:hypothetical protein
MRQTVSAALAAASLLFAGCQNGSVATSPQAFPMSTVPDMKSLRRSADRWQSMEAQGYHLRFRGYLSEINIYSKNGHPAVVARAGPGDSGEITWVLAPENVFELTARGSRSKSLWGTPGCDEACMAGGGSPNPQPQQTFPPNYNGCKAAGGATWFDESTGTGGCLGPGGSRGLPCAASWSYSSPGKGRFRSNDGFWDFDGLPFVSVNPDGNSCHIGNY